MFGAAHPLVADAESTHSSQYSADAFIIDAADMVRRGIPTIVYVSGSWRTEPDEGIPATDLIMATRFSAARSVITGTQREEACP
jgi:hypothetical protein